MMNNIMLKKCISISAFIVLVLAVAETRAQFWKDENLIEYNGFQTGYVLNKGEKNINILGNVDFYFLDGLMLGSNFYIDLIMTPNILLKYRLFSETRFTPAVTLNISMVKSLLIQSIASSFLDYADIGYFVSLTAKYYEYSVSAGISKCISKKVWLHGYAGLNYGELIWSSNFDETKESPLDQFNISNSTTSFNDSILAIGTEYRISDRIRTIISIRYSSSKNNVMVAIRMLLAANKKLRIEAGLPAKLQVFWRF